MKQGFLLSAMVFAAVLVWVIERQFRRAAAWLAAASVLASVGLIHGYALTAEGIENRFGIGVAPGFSVMYGLGALVVLVFDRISRRLDV